MQLSEYTIIENMDSSCALLFNGCTGAVDIVSMDMAEILKSSRVNLDFSCLDRDTKRHLMDRGHLVKDAQIQRELVRYIGRRLHKKNLQTSGFFIIPTYSCQLSCYYCCQQKRWSSGREDDNHNIMSFPMIDAAFKAMNELNPMRIKSLNIYGGEPLQEKNYSVISRIVELSERGEYILAVTTNGLECEKFEKLIGPKKINGICFSVHGLPNEVEWQRLDSNVRLSLSRGAFVAIRINADARTIGGIGRIFERARDYPWFSHPMLSYNICPVLPTATPPSFEVIEPEEYESKLIEMQADGSIPCDVEYDASAGRQLQGILKRGIPDPVHPRHPSFCGSKRGIFVFDPCGDIYTCHEAVNDPSFSIGQYFPTLRFNKLSISKQAQWIPETRSDCLSCPFALLCGGGCIHRSSLPISGRDMFYCRWVRALVNLALKKYASGRMLRIKNYWL